MFFFVEKQIFLFKQLDVLGFDFLIFFLNDFLSNPLIDPKIYEIFERFE